MKRVLASQETLTTLRDLPGIYKLHKIAGQHSFYYPPPFYPVNFQIWDASYIVRAIACNMSVRLSRNISKTALRIFLIFCIMLHMDEVRSVMEPDYSTKFWFIHKVRTYVQNDVFCNLLKNDSNDFN